MFNPHAPIIKLSQRLGLPTSPAGVCRGLAAMGVLAGLANDLFTLHCRLVFLRAVHEGKVNLEFNSSFFANPFIASPILKLKDKEVNFFMEYPQPVNGQTGRMITVNQRDIESFLTMLNAMQCPGKYAALNIEGRPRSQHEMLEWLPWFAPTEIEKSGKSIEQSNPKTGCYTREELKRYFELLTSITETAPICLLLTGYDHSIAVQYDPGSSNRDHKWAIVGGNGVKRLSPSDLADYIYDHHFRSEEHSFLPLASVLYYTDRLAKDFDTLGGNEEWRQIHEDLGMMREKVNSLSVLGEFSWLSMAAYAGDIPTVKRLLPHDSKVMHPELYYSPLMAAVQNHDFEMILTLLEEPSVAPTWTMLAYMSKSELLEYITSRSAEEALTLCQKALDPNTGLGKFFALDSVLNLANGDIGILTKIAQKEKELRATVEATTDSNFYEDILVVDSLQDLLKVKESRPAVDETADSTFSP